MCLTAALAALSLGLAACGLNSRAEAARGAERFLAAVHGHDRAAFEAAIDRPAVREDLRRQLIAVAKAGGVEVEGGPSDFALDRMITPEAFQLVERQTGGAAPAGPSAAQLQPMMQAVDKTHVCLKDADRCLLTFARRKDGWRLVGMQATDLKILLPADGK
ncbi:MAG: hypothetical protein ABI655_09890 [Phenylobacterium sp.]